MKSLQQGLRGQHLKSQYQTVFFSLRIMMSNGQNKILQERSIWLLEMILITICNYNISRVFSHDFASILPRIRFLPAKTLWMAHLISGGINQIRHRILFTTPSPSLKCPKAFLKAISATKNFMDAKSMRDNCQFKGKIERMNCLTTCVCFQSLV